MRRQHRAAGALALAALAVGASACASEPAPSTPAATTTAATAAPAPEPVDVPDWQLVWADEFEGDAVDRDAWSFDFGPANDNIQYYTDRTENAHVADGVLEIVTRAEAFEGWGYTSAHLTTRDSVSWRYGRVEASIQLPAQAGLVPAFWMMPAEDSYGWWPHSGEIDVMEFPTTEADHIYGTAHTASHSYFTGSPPLGPRGGTVGVPAASEGFHVYAIEWSPERIEWSVDGEVYFTLENDGTGPGSWPFDQPFFVILNVAVGGGWVGPPPDPAAFPAVMSVDYVRVYQDLPDATISGPRYVASGSTGVVFRAPEVDGLIYDWSVPDGATIVDGQGTARVAVDWESGSGDVSVVLRRSNGDLTVRHAVTVSENLLANGGFETGSLGWRTSAGTTGAAFRVDAGAARTGAAGARVDVESAGANPWDAQMSQPGVELEAGASYTVSLWARADDPGSTIGAAMFDPLALSVLGGDTFVLSDEWAEYEFTFTAPDSVTATLNIDVAAAAGGYAIDDVGVTAR